MTTQVDIARLLTHAAGTQLAKAHIASQKKNAKGEIETSIQATILFQAGMEAIINEEIQNHDLLVTVKKENEALLQHYKSLSFKNKWQKSYEALQIRETDYLLQYLHFYSQYRVQITHPHSRFLSVQKYRFTNVYPGMENGWYAAQLLFAILGKELTSWETFCHEIGLPIVY